MGLARHVVDAVVVAGRSLTKSARQHGISELAVRAAGPVPRGPMAG